MSIFPSFPSKSHFLVHFSPPNLQKSKFFRNFVADFILHVIALPTDILEAKTDILEIKSDILGTKSDILRMNIQPFNGEYIATQLGMPYVTVQRVLKRLESLHLIENIGGKRYRQWHIIAKLAEHPE